MVTPLIVRSGKINGTFIGKAKSQIKKSLNTVGEFQIDGCKVAVAKDDNGYWLVDVKTGYSVLVGDRRFSTMKRAYSETLRALEVRGLFEIYASKVNNIFSKQQADTICISML